MDLVDYEVVIQLGSPVSWSMALRVFVYQSRKPFGGRQFSRRLGGKPGNPLRNFLSNVTVFLQPLHQFFCNYSAA